MGQDESKLVRQSLWDCAPTIDPISVEELVDRLEAEAPEAWSAVSRAIGGGSPLQYVGRLVGYGLKERWLEERWLEERPSTGAGRLVRRFPGATGPRDALRPVTVRLPKELDAALTTEAKRRACSRTEVVHLALQQFLNL